MRDMVKAVRRGGAAVLIAALAACATGGRGAEGAADEGAAGISLDEAIERSAADIAGRLAAGTRVAIVAFDAPALNTAAYVMDELTGALVNGALEVADRNNLAYVYRELNFQLSGDVSDETAQSVGKFLGAQYVVTGQLVDAGDTYRYRLNGIKVETAVHESSSRFSVRADRALKNLFAALEKGSAVTKTAAYGEAPPASYTPAAPKTAGTFLDRGILFAGRGEYAMAIEDFTEALELDPELRSAWMLRGMAYYASASYVTGIGENFSSVDTATTAGRKAAAAEQAAYDRAVADFSRAIRLDPNDAKAYNSRGVAYDSKGEYDRAIADYNQAIRLDPNNASAYNNRGNAYYAKGEYDRAIDDYGRAIRLDPDYANAYNNRGNVYYFKGEYDRAIDDYDRAIRLDPNDANAYNNRGAAYYAKGEYDRAVADYGQAIRLDPNGAAAYMNRGNAYYDKKDYDRAIADYNQAIRLHPNGAAAYNSRGNAYWMKRDKDRARADWRKALELDPNDAAARKNLALE
ncbi:MAG: tetratricopeptide repeat protein [Treponema sp.]|jgi:tetratricopeptide (TPR) repeat protein|nr:tetratricopeptide repeat protein [Treponema sp.]